MYLANWTISLNNTLQHEITRRKEIFCTEYLNKPTSLLKKDLTQINLKHVSTYKMAFLK